MQTMLRRSRIAGKPTFTTGISKWGSNLPSKINNQMKNDALKETKQPAKSLYEKRRRFGQCYKCGEQYKQGNQCHNKGLHLIDGMDEDDEEFKKLKKEILMG